MLTPNLMGLRLEKETDVYFYLRGATLAEMNQVFDQLWSRLMGPISEGSYVGFSYRGTEIYAPYAVLADVLTRILENYILNKTMRPELRMN